MTFSLAHFFWACQPFPLPIPFFKTKLFCRVPGLFPQQLNIFWTIFVFGFVWAFFSLGFLVVLRSLSVFGLLFFLRPIFFFLFMWFIAHVWSGVHTKTPTINFWDIKLHFCRRRRFFLFVVGRKKKRKQLKSKVNTFDMVDMQTLPLRMPKNIWGPPKPDADAKSARPKAASICGSSEPQVPRTQYIVPIYICVRVPWPYWSSIALQFRRSCRWSCRNRSTANQTASLQEMVKPTSIYVTVLFYPCQF